MQINNNITQILEVPLRSETANEGEYRVKVEQFLQTLKPFSADLKSLANNLNGFISWVNENAEQIQDNANKAENAKNLTQSYKADVETIWQKLSVYSVPQDTTYNKDELDSLADELIRVTTGVTYALTEHNNTFNDIYSKIYNLQDNLKSEVITINNKIESVKNSLITDYTNKINATKDNLQTQINNLSTKEQNDYNNLDNRVATLEMFKNRITSDSLSYITLPNPNNPDNPDLSIKIVWGIIHTNNNIGSATFPVTFQLTPVVTLAIEAKGADEAYSIDSLNETTLKVWTQQASRYVFFQAIGI